MKALMLLVAWIAITLWIFYTYAQWRARRRAKKTDSNDNNADDNCHSHGGICCGLHEICEKGLPRSAEDLYYNDEELDRLAHRQPSTYTDDEIAELTYVYDTLHPDERRPWVRALARRGIHLPSSILRRLDSDDR